MDWNAFIIHIYIFMVLGTRKPKNKCLWSTCFLIHNGCHLSPYMVEKTRGLSRVVCLLYNFSWEM